MTAVEGARSATATLASEAGSRSWWRATYLLLGGRRMAVAAIVAASVLSGLSESAMLALVAQVAAAMVDGSDRVVGSVGPADLDVGIVTVLTVAFVLVLARLAFQTVLTYLLAHVSATTQARLRRDLFEAFSEASWDVQAEEDDGHLQELLTSQTAQATQGVLFAVTLASSSLTFLVMVASALLLSVPVALFVLVTAAFLFFVMRPLAARGRQHGQDLSQAHLEFAGGVGEAVRLAEECRVFGAEKAQRRHVGALIDRIKDLYFRALFLARLVQSTYQALVILLVIGGLAGLYAVGANRLASLGAVVLILVRAGTYGQSAQGAHHALQQVFPFVDRIQFAERRYRESPKEHGHEPMPEPRTLSFQGVSFAYGRGQPAVRNVSFQVASGEAIGIIGPSGAGKSTLVQLLLRLRVPDSGVFLVNGLPASNFALADWQRRVAYVPQDPRVLHATVADNIRYFRDLDDDAVRGAAKLAAVHDDILGWQRGYDTIIGQRADGVSGGERQRICLARALAAAPDVLVLDEPTSALDLISEALIQKSLTELKGSVTLFVVAHRLSTLVFCDRVIVMNEGQVTALDAASALGGSNEFYQGAVRLSAASVGSQLPSDVARGALESLEDRAG